MGEELQEKKDFEISLRSDVWARPKWQHELAIEGERVFQISERKD